MPNQPFRPPRPPSWDTAPADATLLAYHCYKGWEWFSGNNFPAGWPYTAVIVRAMAEDVEPEVYEAMIREKFGES